VRTDDRVVSRNTRRDGLTIAAEAVGERRRRSDECLSWTTECGEHDFNTYSHNDRDIYIIF
jgi:hypothetical protein